MKRLLGCLVLHASVATALLAPALPALAVTPTDYALPYSVAQNGEGEALGITLVRSAQFRQSAVLVPATTPVREPHVYATGTLVDGVFPDFRPQLLSWGQGNRWRRANLRGGLAPVPVLVSSENAVDSACPFGSRAIERNFRNADNSALIYTLPGTDGNCDTSDDVVRAISLNDAPTTAPISLPLTTLNLQPVHTNALLRSVYAYNAATATLLRFSINLASSSVVASGIGSVMFQGHTEDGTVIAIIDGKLRGIRANGVLIPKPLKTPAAGYRVSQTRMAGTDIFFLETTVSPTDPVRASLYRVPADGSAPAIRLVNLSSAGTIWGVSDTRVVYTAGGSFNFQTGMFIPADLLTVPRAGGEAPIRLQRASSAFISVALVASNRVFYTVNAFGPAGLSPTAYVRADSGALESDFRRGSSWGGLQLDNAQSRLLLASRGLNGTTSGALLSSVNPADLSNTTLPGGRLPADARLLFGGGSGPASLGLLEADPDGNPGNDVFAFDLFGNRHFRLTADGGANAETPIF